MHAATTQSNHHGQMQKNAFTNQSQFSIQWRNLLNRKHGGRNQNYSVFGREHGILSIGIDIHLSLAACEIYISDGDDKTLTNLNIRDLVKLISSCRSSSAMNLSK